MRKLNVTDRQTDGQTDGGHCNISCGAECNISRPGPSAPREIITAKLNEKLLTASLMILVITAVGKLRSSGLSAIVDSETQNMENLIH